MGGAHINLEKKRGPRKKKKKNTVSKVRRNTLGESYKLGRRKSTSGRDMHKICLKEDVDRESREGTNE